MDATAIVLCRDNNLPLRVFNLNDPATWCASCAARTSARWSRTERRAPLDWRPLMLEDIKKDAADRMHKCVVALPATN